MTIWALIQGIVGAQDSGETTEDTLRLRCSRSSAGRWPPTKEVYERKAKLSWIKSKWALLLLSYPIG